MMKRIAFFSTWMALACCVAGQNVQWASKVLSYSTQNSTVTKSFSQQIVNKLSPNAPQNATNAFAAKEVVGKPDVLPAYWESPCAWTFSQPDNPKDEYLRVGFERPMQIRQIAIGECYNPGGIVKVILIDVMDKEYPIYENAHPAPMKELGRMFKLKVPLTKFKVKEARIIINSKDVPGFQYIDAVGISDSDSPIEAPLKLSAEYQFGMQAQPLPSKVNSEFNELVPVLADDGNVLYFCRDGHPGNVEGAGNQDVWYATRNGKNDWAEPVHLGEPINNKGHNAIAAIFNNGQTALLENAYLADGSLSMGISLATKTENGWGNPRQMDIRNYYNRCDYSEFFITPDGKTLLMAVWRDDTKGSKDLYVSFEANGVFAEPRHLGPDVNTLGSESAPFLAADGVTLFFGSNGRSGYGNSDIYVSKRLDDSWMKWSEPENLGPNVNTAGYESYFKIPTSGEYAFLSRQADVVNKNDIYQVLLPASLLPNPTAIVSGRLIDAQSQVPLDGVLTYQVEGSDTPMGTVAIKAATGEYSLLLPLGAKYKLIAKSAGYLNAGFLIDLQTQTKSTSLKQDFAMKAQ